LFSGKLVLLIIHLNKVALVLKHCKKENETINGNNNSSNSDTITSTYCCTYVYVIFLIAHSDYMFVQSFVSCTATHQKEAISHFGHDMRHKLHAYLLWFLYLPQGLNWNWDVSKYFVLPLFAFLSVRIDSCSSYPRVEIFEKSVCEIYLTP
jgi:hypothetical protein